MNIPVQEYLDYSWILNEEELALRTKLLQYLPDTVIDCHAHCNLKEHVIGIDEEISRLMMSTFPYFSLENSYYTKELLYPGKTVHTLRFAMPY